MDREAFTVLPPLSPRLPPPPPTPAPTRIAPPTVAHKESSAFVIISELKTVVEDEPSKKVSGRTSPFRGRGFRERSPASPSRIPVASKHGKSAPASPVRKVKPVHQALTVGGKSAPASPKRVTTRPPPVPRNLKKSVETRNNNNNIANNNKLATSNKPTTTIITSNKPPLQVTRKKPTPAVRNKISGKTKPITTEVTIGSLGKNRFVKPVPPATAPRKSVEKNDNNNNNKNNINGHGNVSKDKKPVTENKSANDTEKTDESAGNENSKIHELNQSSPPDHVTIVETPKVDTSKTQQSSVEPKNGDSPPVITRETKTVIAEVTSAPPPNHQHHKTTLHVEADVRQIPPVHAAVNGLSPGQKVTTTADVPMGEAKKGEGEDTAEATLVEWTIKHPKELAQPDVIPNDLTTVGVEAIEEVTTTTVQGPAEVEVEGGNHTVKFSSPEIHPVSPRVKKQGLFKRLKDGMTGCVSVDAFRRHRRRSPKVSPGAVGKLKKSEEKTLKKEKEKEKKKKKKEEKKAGDKSKKQGGENGTVGNNATETSDNNNKKASKFSTKMTALSKFSTKKKKEPPPPRLAGVETPAKGLGPTKAQDGGPASKAKTKLGLLNRLNCLKKKEDKVLARTKKSKLQRAQATVQPGRGSCWRRIFCLDRACCVKCRRNKGGGVPGAVVAPPPKPKKPEFKRSTSIGGTSLPKLDQTLVEHASVMKAAIPVLPICLAWTCLLINVFLPGIGTVTSGFLCLCFGKPRFSVNDSMRARLGSLSVNLVIGVGQLFTVIFCLVGWGWSIWWGIIMLKLARKHKRIKLAEKSGLGTATTTPVNRHRSDLELGAGEGEQ